MTTADAEPIESHSVHCERLLAHAAPTADQLIAQDDRLQASEKIWGAAVHGLKTIADARGWPYDYHPDGRVIARYLARQSGNRRIAHLFDIAEAAHRNFYKDLLTTQDLQEYLAEIREALELLNAAHLALPSDLSPPTDSHYRRRHDLSPADG